MRHNKKQDKTEQSRDAICKSVHVIVLDEISFQCLHINDVIIYTTAMMCVAFDAVFLKMGRIFS
jgi:hypothetical protein